MTQHNERVEEIVAQLGSDLPCFECDGSGNIPHQVSEEEWTAQQCQTCWQYRFPAIAKLRENLQTYTAECEARGREIAKKYIYEHAEPLGSGEGFQISMEDLEALTPPTV